MYMKIERKEKENIKIYFYMLLNKSTNYMTKWKIQHAEKLHRARPVDEEKKVLFYIYRYSHLQIFFFSNKK